MSSSGLKELVVDDDDDLPANTQHALRSSTNSLLIGGDTLDFRFGSCFCVKMQIDNY